MIWKMLGNAGPKVDPLKAPEDETDEFLIKLSMAYSDFDEFLAQPMAPYQPSGFHVIPTSPVWNPKPGPPFK